MSFERRDYLRHVLAEADYLIAGRAGVTFDEIVRDVVQNRIPELRRQITAILEA